MDFNQGEKGASLRTTMIVMWLLCFLGSLAILPYVLELGVIPDNISVARLVIGVSIQSLLFFGLVCLGCYFLIPKTDLRPFQPCRQALVPSIVSGLSVGVIIFWLQNSLFANLTYDGVYPSLWASILASFYGAINEEVLCRLFLFTLLYFLLGKALPITRKYRLFSLWLVNVFVAVVFGLGHLPGAFNIMTPSLLGVSRILLLNGIAGVTFGWLYWTRGIWAAIMAHFIADIVIHVVLI